MAVTTQIGAELTNQAATPPVLTGRDLIGGRLHMAYFSHTQSGAGDATSSVKVVHLPPGQVTLLGFLSRIEHNWTTASATMDVGWDAYTNVDGTAVAADPNGLDDGINVDTAGATAIGSILGADMKQFDSKNGVDIRLTSQDVALADADTCSGYLIYVTG